MRRTHLTRNLRERKPEWKWDKAHGKLVRDGKGGIDWYRYQNKVLRPKLLPFAVECKKERPNTIVMEDGAASHSHRYQQTVYSAFNIERMLWPSNSPDLNMIEPCWYHPKRQTTRV